LKSFNLLKSNERIYNPFYKWSIFILTFFGLLILVTIPVVLLNASKVTMQKEILEVGWQLERHPTIVMEKQIVDLRTEIEETIKSMDATGKKAEKLYMLSTFLMNDQNVKQIKLLIMEEGSYNAQLHFANNLALDQYIAALEKNESLPLWNYSIVENQQEGINLFISWFWNEEAQQ
jgi:hypothetical protein